MFHDYNRAQLSNFIACSVFPFLNRGQERLEECEKNTRWAKLAIWLCKLNSHLVNFKTSIKALFEKCTETITEYVSFAIDLSQKQKSVLFSFRGIVTFRQSNVPQKISRALSFFLMARALMRYNQEEFLYTHLKKKKKKKNGTCNRC